MKYLRLFAIAMLIVIGGSLGDMMERNYVRPALAQLAGTWDFTAATMTLPNFQLAPSNAIAANGAVASSVTSLGPTGSHTTIQEWAIVKGTGGATRWIPLF